MFSAFQALAKLIGPNDYIIKPIKMHFNIYTIPGYFMVFMSIINFVVVVIYFTENLEIKENFKREVRRLRRRKFWKLLININ